MTGNRRAPQFSYAFVYVVILIIILFGDVLPWGEAGDAIAINLSGIKQYFQYYDGWSLVASTLIASLAIILQSINILLIEKVWSQFRPLLRSLLAGITFFSQVILACFALHILATRSIIHSADSIPKRRYPAIILGTSKYVKPGAINVYYWERIQTCVTLYRQGSLKSLIISGDGMGKAYNEVRDISSDLIEFGVTLIPFHYDPHGTRTLVSILNTKRLIEGQDTVLIISQVFHLQRALLLARAAGMNAIGISAAGNMTRAMLIREFFARPKLLLETYLMNLLLSDGVEKPRRFVSPFYLPDGLILAATLMVTAIAARILRMVFR